MQANLEMKRKHTRIYPDVNVGDYVKYITKNSVADKTDRLKLKRTLKNIISWLKSLNLFAFPTGYWKEGEGWIFETQKGLPFFKIVCFSNSVLEGRRRLDI